MAEKKHIIIVCGEASGDLNASNLVKAIKQINPDIAFSGVGGKFLQDAGAQIFYDIKKLSVMGLTDVLKKLPNFFALKKLVLDKIRREKPTAVILVDFSGFNLRLAKEIDPSTTLRINGERSRTIDKNIPIIYYTSPQIWASRQGRIKTIKEHISKMMVFFRFEEEFYKKYGINADFVGHPLLDIVKPSMEKNDFFAKFALSSSKTTIALLPGSRKSEIDYILPVMLKASMFIAKDIPGCQFIIAKSPQVSLDIYNRKLQGLNLDIKIIEGSTYDCVNTADFCLVCSGTATLETAILQKPFAVIYKMNLLNYLLYSPQVKVPYIGMVNIVAGKKIVPEFIQFKATAKNISQEALRILKNPAEIERMKNNLAQVKSSLGETGASLRAARIIVDFLK